MRDVHEGGDRDVQPLPQAQLREEREESGTAADSEAWEELLAACAAFAELGEEDPLSEFLFLLGC